MTEFRIKPLLNIRRKKSQATQIELKKLAKANSNVQALINLGFGKESKEFHKLGGVLKNMKSLFRLDACITSVSHNRFEILYLSLKQVPLRSLKIYFCLAEDLNDARLKLLSQNLKHFSFLKSLTLQFTLNTFENEETLTSKGVSMLFSSIKPLNQLSNLKIGFFEMETFDNCCLKELSSALKNLRSLQTLKLDLSGCSKVNDEGLANFSKELKKLTNLTTLGIFMKDCNLIDKDVRSLAGGLIEIKTLTNLSLNLDLPPQYIPLEFRRLNSLSVINFDFDLWLTIRDEEMKSFSSCFEFLVPLKKLKLSFKSCEQITDAGIEYLALGLGYLTSLKSLELYFSNCPKLQKIGSLAHSFERSINLSELKIIFERCGDIENQGIETIFTSFRNLIFLVDLNFQFAGCKFMNDSSLKLLASDLASFPHLLKLTLKFSNSQISDIGLESLILNLEKLPSLNFLDLNFSSCQISDNGMKSLSLCLQKFKSLISLALEFSQNIQIGEKGVESLISKITHLKSLCRISLCFSECQRMSQQKLKSICTSLKNFTISYNDFEYFYH